MVRYVNIQDRRVAAYAAATTIDQDMLDETFRGGENQLEAIGIITKTIGMLQLTLRFSDRPKFVDNDWYEGRAVFPSNVKRTVGELQAPTIQFSQYEVQLNNVDGFYNEYLESGDTYINFTGARMQIKLGLRDVGSTFFTIFDGYVPDEGGFDVQRDRIIIRANDRFTKLNAYPNLPVINLTDFPSAPDDSVGRIIPFAIGDWEAGYNIVDNAGIIQVTAGGVSYDVVIVGPNSFYGGLIGYYVGGGYFVFSIGTYTPGTISYCHLKRGDTMIKVAFTATPANTAGYWSVAITGMYLSGGGTLSYVYASGDLAVVGVKIPYAVGKYSNPIELTQEIFEELGDIDPGDFDSSWATIAAKSTPAQSAMTSIKARVWIGDQKESIISLALGLLEQVRCEAFFDLNGTLKLATLHPEDFPDPDDCPRIEQVEIDERSVTVRADERTFFNKAFLNYAFTPVTKKTELQTLQKQNSSSISKSGKTIAKVIDCPSLYVTSDADNQLIEFLRFYSTGLNYVEARVAWVHILRDLTDFVSFTYSLGSLAYSNVPMQVRDIGIDPATASPMLRLLSFANFWYADFQPSNYLRFLSSASQTIDNA